MNQCYAKTLFSLNVEVLLVNEYGLSEPYAGFPQKYNMEHFAKIINNFK